MTEGLSVLEYRGYDSVGIAAAEASGIKIVKCRGRIRELEEKEELKATHASCAIGHTRWATHGGPSDTNAHPHRAGRVVLVHNGIIENYQELKMELEKMGRSFFSETDTEVAAAVLDACYTDTNDPLSAISNACARLNGSYAFGILFEDRAGEVYAARSGSPLIIAKGTDGYYLASDLTALLPFTREYAALEEGEIACLSAKEAIVFGLDGKRKSPSWKVSEMSAESAQKGGHAHFMRKEILEQPEAIRKSVATRIKNGLPDFSADGIDADFWKGIQRIQIVACGSAMHAGLVGARLFEEVACLPTTVHIASEYRYYPPLGSEGTLVLLISQSGETADTLAALRYAKASGLPTLAIVNAVGTTIAREADRCIYTYAGPEIAVATTKGYCTQASVLYLIAAAIAHFCGRRAESEIRSMVCGISSDAPRAVKYVLDEKGEQIQSIAQRIASCENAFYIGRGLDYAMAQEAALKLKEISYVHAEAYAAGELKHGTISLVEEGTPVLALCTETKTDAKTESNVREVASRGAHVVLICREDMADAHASVEDLITLPCESDAAALFAALVTVQTIAYEVAFARGCDIDRPRNLAKSVTVE